MSGQLVDERAVRASTRVALALGSKSPNVVFDDAVIEGAILGIFAAAGQTRIVGSRLVQRSAHNEFIDKRVAFPLTAKTGDPTTYDTQVGPVTTPSQYKKIFDYIAAGRAEGRRWRSAEAADKERFGGGWFIEPTIFTGVNNKMRLAQREIFGPVLSVVPLANDVAIANDTPYGLAAGMATQGIRRSIIMSERPRVGTV